MRFLISILFIGLFFSAKAQVLRKRTHTLMGSRWQISLVAKDSLLAEQHIDTVIHEVSRIERLISDWIPESQVSQVNTNAGIRPVKVDQEVLDLTRRAIRLSEITNGAFDISFAAMDRIWKFDGSMTAMPSIESIRKSVEKVGYKNIVLDSINNTIFLKLKGMKIGFGALGEGYAADKSRVLMINKGIKAGIVNGSGDMSTWGKQPDGRPWSIGITNPVHIDALLAIIPLKEGSVVTSGNYEKYVSFNGRRYSHIINPVSGYPATGLTSVTVFGPSTEMANGFSTSMMVLGKDAALRFIQNYPEYQYVMITDEGKVISSAALELKIRHLKQASNNR